MNSNYKGKRLLVIGGASQHCKIVEKAKEMGIETYVTDFLPDAPAKRMADHSYQINVTDTEGIKKLCEDEKIDGIISGWFDFCQMPYQLACDATGLTSYGTKEQFETLTRKANFKAACEKYGVGQPTPFDWKKFLENPSEDLPYPLFVKPSDSRGSRGASVCRTVDELRSAIENAKKESYDGNAVAERYIENAKMILAVYFFVDGEPYLQQLSDAYFGDKKYGQEKINVVYKSPSRYADTYKRVADEKMKNMLRKLGLKNGPACFQAFLTDDDVFFYDPGRRFPGGEYERGLKRAIGVDYVQIMIEFALCGKIDGHDEIRHDLFDINGKHIMRLQINSKPGIVKNEIGFDEIAEIPGVEYVAMYHTVGDEILNSGDVRMRYAQVVFVSDTIKSLKESVKRVYERISVISDDGSELLVEPFNMDLIK